MPAIREGKSELPVGSGTGGGLTLTEDYALREAKEQLDEREIPSFPTSKFHPAGNRSKTG